MLIACPWYDPGMIAAPITSRSSFLEALPFKSQGREKAMSRSFTRKEPIHALLILGVYLTCIVTLENAK